MNNNISKITTTIHLSREIHNPANNYKPVTTLEHNPTNTQNITRHYIITKKFHANIIQATTQISPMNKQRQICTSSLLTEASSSVFLVSTCISQLIHCIYQLHSYFSQLQTYIYLLHPRPGFHSIHVQASNSRATFLTSTQLLDRIHTFQDHAIKNNHISQLLTT
jgi:hypothetical protein